VLLALFWPFGAAPPSEAIDSIAVLPFENRSGNPELEYVSDGITQGVISRLSQLSSLDKVISSSSVRQLSRLLLMEEQHRMARTRPATQQ